jgi:heme-degrading monooxygenase HmoA
MYARVSNYVLPPEGVEQAISGFAELPIEELEGFSGAYLLVDRESGKSITITLWDSEAALEKSVERANQMRAQVTQNVGGQTTDVAHYEVGVAKEPTGAASGG